MPDFVSIVAVVAIFAFGMALFSLIARHQDMAALRKRIGALEERSFAPNDRREKMWISAPGLLQHSFEITVAEALHLVIDHLKIQIEKTPESHSYFRVKEPARVTPSATVEISGGTIGPDVTIKRKRAKR